MLRSVMNNQPDTQATPATNNNDNTPNAPVNEKHVDLVGKTTDLITRWSGPFISFLSYGLILGLATTGLGLMAISAIIGLFFDSTTHSGFGFLTGGVFLTVGCTMILWKMTHALKGLNQQKNKCHTAR